MIDDFEENQNEYEYDEELERILTPDRNQETALIRRGMNASQKQRKVRKQGIFLIRLRKFARFLITLLVLYFTYRLMISAKWYLPQDTITSYEIKRIQIVGNRITPTYKIISVISNIELPNKPIYMIDMEEFSRKILSLAPAKRVYVKRVWYPARIIIYIEEREPILTIAPSVDVEPVAYFAKDGKLVGHEYLPLPPGYNSYLVLSYGNQNDDYMHWSKEKVLSIEKLAKTLEKWSGENVQYIDMRNPNDVFVRLDSIKIRIGELDANTYNRIKDIKSILAKTRSFEKKIKYIDLSWDESKYLKLGQEDEDLKNAKNSNSSN